MAFFACGTHFEQAPRRSGGLPRPDDSAFRVRWAEWNLVNGRAVGAPIFVNVTKGQSLCHIAGDLLCMWSSLVCPFAGSLLVLGAPGGGGGAGVLLEGLGEGGLLRVA